MSEQVPLFPELQPVAPAQLKEPVEKQAEVLRDVAGEFAVLIRTPLGAEHWVPRVLIRFDGLGQQRVQIEKWKAKEIEL